MKKKYEFSSSRNQSNNSHNSTSLETAAASTTSVRLVTVNRSPTSSRKIYDEPVLKLVNVEQEQTGQRHEPCDDNSVRLVNLAKLPPKYADVFDIPAAKLFNVNEEKSTSSVNLMFPDHLPITPKEAYDNPTYAFWKGDRLTEGN